MLLVVRTLIWSNNLFLLREYQACATCWTTLCRWIWHCSYPLPVWEDWEEGLVRDVKDMGQQMGYHSLEWNWPKGAMNRPIGAGIVDGAKLF